MWKDIKNKSFDKMVLIFRKYIPKMDDPQIFKFDIFFIKSVKKILHVHNMRDFFVLLLKKIYFLKIWESIRFWQKDDQRGFLIIELGFVLVIMGIMLGMGASMFMAYLNFQQEKATSKHQEVVLASIQQYFAQYGYVPCPADVSNGVQRSRCSGRTAVGVVPYRTLGLPAKMAKDGYSNWMTYAVDASSIAKYLTERQSLCRELFKKPSAINVKLSEGTVNKFLNHRQALKRNYDGVIVVLISHGKLGDGSYNNYNKRTKLIKKDSYCKKLNAESWNVFCSEPSCGDRAGYEDKVQWMTKSQIIQRSGISCEDHFFPDSPLSRAR